jgi:hypothetical protein
MVEVPQLNSLDYATHKLQAETADQNDFVAALRNPAGVDPREAPVVIGTFQLTLLQSIASSLVGLLEIETERHKYEMSRRLIPAKIPRNNP